MTTATSAAALLSEPAATPAPAVPAAPVVADPAAAPAAPVAAPVAAPASPAPASNDGKPWFDGIDDPDLKAWATNKNFPDAKTALASYRGLEQLLSSDKVPLPKDEADKEGWDRLYKAAGRPDAPDGYKLPVPEGMDPEFAGVASQWFHEAGIGAKQGEKLAAAWNEYATGQITAAQEAFQTQSKNDMADLTTEWGAKFGPNVELSKRAARQFGLSEQLPALEQALGTKAMMNLLVKMGTGLGEHTFDTGDTSAALGMTPDQAVAEITALRADKTFGAKYLAGDTEAKARMERLHRVAYGG